jgi:xylulokinase
MHALGIDLGTNSVKALIMELETGEIIGVAQRSYGYIEGRETEQDRDLVLGMTTQSVCEAIEESSVNPNQIKAVGLSGQMHGTVLYDPEGKCISNIITWEDTKFSAPVLNEIKSIGGDIIGRSGCGIAAGFLGPTVYYMLNRSETEIGYALLPTDWLRQEITGQKTFLTDHSNASSTGFFHTEERDWNYQLIQKLKLPESIFPEVKSTSSFDGGISKTIAEATGLKAGTPVTIGGGDQPISMIGSGICKPPDGILLNMGTGSQVSKVGDKCTRNDDTIVFCFPERGYSQLGAALAGGAALKWWRNVSEGCANMYGINTCKKGVYREMDVLASEVPPGADGLIFVPYLSGTRSRPHLKASFTGLTRRHGYANFIRALLEGVVFELYYLYEQIPSYARDDVSITAAGGGFSSMLWAQIAADIFARKIKITKCQEQAALGAALIAGVGLGFYSDISEACWKVMYKPETVEPIAENVKLYRKIYEERYKRYLKH